ncbi:MAG: hypothetical protein R3246_16800, partial [Acidimicrobiia bacterium]|nr:hypothetical protein [Acidimicrobiia bacterium]
EGVLVLSSHSSKQSHRDVGVAGIAFVVLFLASTFVGGSDLGGPDQPAEVVAQDLSENRLDALPVSAGLIGLSAIAGYWFVGGLCGRLSTRSSSSAVWVVLTGGIAMVTMVLATSAFAQAAIVVDTLASDPQVAKTLWLIEHGSWAMIGPPQTAFILGVSIIAIETGDPPRWYGYSGIIVALGLVANLLLGLGGLAALALRWVLGLAGVLLFRRPEPKG